MESKPHHRYPFINAPFDWLVFVVVIAAGALFAQYVYLQNVLLVMVDQYSHLSIARQVTDSMTPGLSQLGFWPPLLHLMMSPFAAIDALYYSGLAAAFFLVPVLAISAVYLYRLLLLLTENQFVGLTATAAYVLNPYMLYYSVTPMSDMLYVALVVIATFYFVHWWMTERLLSLVLLGVVISLATLARFEGFMLAAIGGLAILYRMIRQRASFAQIESVIIIYGLPAGAGFMFILLYGVVYSGTPLAFMYNEWGAYAQQRSLFLPTEHNIAVSLHYLIAASRHMLGASIMLMSVISAVFLLAVLRGQRLLFVTVSLMLASPFLFDLLALFQGSAVIYVPELPPYEPTFFNERYGLYWIGFAIVMPALLAAYVYEKIRARGGRFLEPVAISGAAVIVGLMIAGSYTQFERVACEGCFETIYQSRQTSPGDHAVVAEYLRDHYAGGRILMTRALTNEVAVRAGIPLSSYVLEANEHYFDQAVAYPWLFAEWVIMQNRDTHANGSWSLENEQISRRWGEDDGLLEYYDLVLEGGSIVLLRLRHQDVIAYAQEYGIPMESIPSLTQTKRWDVRTTFASLQSYIKDEELVGTQTEDAERIANQDTLLPMIE